MGCCGGEREKGPISEQQKWDYITLDDFKSKSCFTPFSYVWLWILVFTWIGVIVVDTFTAVQLLAFDRWASQVQPKIPFRISKWIYAGAIIFSFVLLTYEIQRAVRVIRRGGVADSYLDPLAVEWQSARMGKGRGWKRFLVFAELTKSKKGADYVALFVYFQFKTAIRILVAEGPRQVINAFTLYSVFQLNLLPTGENAPKDGHDGFQQFWSNLEILANKNERQVIILASMLYTFVIWVISAILLAAAAILYIVFVWHHIPSSDGGLTKYCKRKIDGRLAKIVSKKTRKALEKAVAKERKDERNALKRGETFAKPTLPGVDIDDDASSIISGTTAFSKPPLARTATFDTMNTASSNLARQPTLPDLDDDNESVLSGRPGMSRPAPARSMTGSSYASNAPLLDNGGAMGYSEEPVPSLPHDRDYFNASPSDYRPGPPPRSFTGMTQRSSPLSSGPPSTRGTPAPYGPGGSMRGPSLNRPPTAQSRGAPSPGPLGPGSMRRVDTSDSMNSSFSRRPGPPGAAPSPISPYNDPPLQNRRISPPEQFGPSYEMSPVRTSPPGGNPLDAPHRPPTRQGQMTPGPGPGARPPPQAQRLPPLNRAPTAPPTSTPASGGNGSGYVAFNPSMHNSNAPPSSGTPTPPSQEGQQQQPTRNFSSPVQRFASPMSLDSSSIRPQSPGIVVASQRQGQGWHAGPSGSALNDSQAQETRGQGGPQRSFTIPMNLPG